MALVTTPYKGTRDFYPKDFLVREYIFSVWKEACLRFGYEQYDASIIEPIELYQAKTSEEIVSEQTYNFFDRGGREVTLRPEMTPTVSRMIAGKRQDLAYPVRWFSIPNVWRYERPQKGRLREHWQLNVDLFGIEDISADHEVIMLADTIMQAFKAPRNSYEICISSRQIINFLLHDYLGLDPAEVSTIIRLIDRKNKMDYAQFCALLSASISPTHREDLHTDEKLLQILEAKTIEDLPEAARIHPSIIRLREVVDILKGQGITNIRFDVTLMRGFMYYTDMVFEVFDTSPENNRSLFGGGRYDGLVGQFGVEPLPTIGFGMGDVTLRDFLETHRLLPKLHTSVHAVAVLVDDVYTRALPLIQSLRSEGAHVCIDSTGKKLDKKLKNVDKAGVPYALIIGEGELEEGRITVRDMKRGTQERHAIERVISVIMADTDKELE